PCAMPQVPSARCSLTLPEHTSADGSSSRSIQATNTAPCRCTIGGAGGKSPRRAGRNEGIPHPANTNRHIASVMQKKIDGLKLRTGVEVAAATDAVMALPQGVAR